MTETATLPKRNQHIERFADNIIVSIFPVRCEKQMNAINGFKQYVLDAAPRGGWSTLVVETSGQWLTDMSSVDESNPTPGMRMVETPAWDEANELVRHWTSNTAGGRGRPGIGLLPYGVQPPLPGEKASSEFASFLAELNAIQTEFAQYHVKDANDKKTKGDMRNITNTHREMAKWLFGDGAEKLDWYGKTTYMDTKSCIACSRQVISTALVCEHCGTNFIDWHIKYETEPENDQPVAAALARVRGKSSQSAPIAPAPIDYGIELPKVEVKDPIDVVEENDDEGEFIPAAMAEEIEAESKKKA